MPATIEVTTQFAGEADKRMNATAARMATIVAEKLGAPVTFDHWERHATGDVPVFNVPQSHAKRARGLGLTVSA